MSEAAASSQQSVVAEFLETRLRWIALSMGSAIFAMAVAAVATLGAGTSYVGEAVVVLDQPGITYSKANGLEAFQMFATIAPTLAERARSDQNVAAVNAATSRDDTTRDARRRVSATVLPNTVAIRLRVAYPKEADALAGVEALVASFTADVESITAPEVPPVDIDVIRAPTTFDNRPDVGRSVIIAGIIGLLLGIVAAAVLERS